MPFGGIQVECKENITFTQFTELLEEDLFLDYFNKFLCLPIFPQCLLIEKSNPWEFKMYPKLNEKYVLNSEGILKYLWKRMYSAFIKTKFYVEYLIAKELLLAPMTQSIDNRVAGFEDDYQNLLKKSVNWLKMKCLSGATKIRKFRNFLINFPEAYKLFQYWLDIEYFYQNPSPIFRKNFQFLKQKYFHCDGLIAFHQQLLDAANNPPESRAYDVNFAFRLQSLCFQKISCHWLLNYLLISRVNVMTSYERSYMLLAHDFLRGEAPSRDLVEELHECGDVINALPLVSTFRSNTPVPCKVQRIAMKSAMEPMTSLKEGNLQESSNLLKKPEKMKLIRMKKIRRWSVVNSNQYKLRFADGDAMNLYRIEYNANISVGKNLPKLKEASMTSRDLDVEMSLQEKSKKLDSGDFEVLLYEEYRDDDENRRIIAALQTDEAAANPFQIFLNKNKNLKNLHQFLFWRDVEQLRKNFKFCIKSFDCFLIALREVADKYLVKNAPKQIAKDRDNSEAIAQLKNSDYVTLPSKLRELHEEVFFQIKPLFYEFWQKELDLFYEKAVSGSFEAFELKNHFCQFKNDENEECNKKREVEEVTSYKEMGKEKKRMRVIYQKKKKREEKEDEDESESSDEEDEEYKMKEKELRERYEKLKERRDKKMRRDIEAEIMIGEEDVRRVGKRRSSRKKKEGLPKIERVGSHQSLMIADVIDKDLKLPKIKVSDQKQNKAKKKFGNKFRG